MLHAVVVVAEPLHDSVELEAIVGHDCGTMDTRVLHASQIWMLSWCSALS